jgi:hypothetical protein
MAPGNNRLRSAKITFSYLTVAIVPVIQDELTRLMIPLQFFLKIYAMVLLDTVLLNLINY